MYRNLIVKCYNPEERLFSSFIWAQKRYRQFSCLSIFTGDLTTRIHRSFFKYDRFLRTSFSKYDVNL